MTLAGLLIGGAAGYAVGGPLGAAIGAALGRALSRVGRMRPLRARAGAVALLPAAHQDELMISLRVLAEAVADADGARAPESEAVLNRLAPRLPSPAAGQAQTSHDQWLHARRLARAAGHEAETLAEVADRLIQVAQADGVVSPAEHKVLRAIAAEMGLAEEDLTRLLRARVGVTAGTPYGVLGLPTDAGWQEVRRAFFTQAQLYHPDRLARTGATPAEIARANHRLRLLHSAFDTIKRAQIAAPRS